MKKDILIEYDNKKSLYDSLGNKCKTLIKELLEVNWIMVHHLSHRTKKKENLEEKLIRKWLKYNCLEDVTDLSWIRIITYFAEDVSTIADIIKSEFKVDEENTIDKRDLEEDRFWYLSMHYVVSISESRLKLAEYKNFKKLKIEIQIRSILQHWWAEIEHDLGYKWAKWIPAEFKRDFSRIAALLETADNEFNRLRRELNNYNLEIRKDYKALNKSLKINNTTLGQFLEQNKYLILINQEIANFYQVPISKNLDEINIWELTEKLRYNNFTNISDLNKALEENFTDLKSSLNILLHYDYWKVSWVNKSVWLHTFIEYLKYRRKKKK